MRTVGSAFIKTKKGKLVGFKLIENQDGYYFDNRKVASLRNWMSAQTKAREIFKQIKQEYKNSGDFIEAGSTMWHEENSSGFNYSYEVKKPKSVTPLKNYGTHDYNLGFQVNKNMKLINGKWVFDEVFYTIEWYPTNPITIQITKKTYKNGSKFSDEKLSDIVNVNDIKGVNRLITKFKEIYNKHKSSENLK